MSYKKLAAEMNAMVGQGQFMEAFEKFYHPNVVMIEATGEVREGKDLNREFQINFLASIKETHAGGVDAITSDEENDITMVEGWIDVTFQDGNRARIEEVARQKWQDDLIIEERFYYNAAGME